jgi:hypothetical protein
MKLKEFKNVSNNFQFYYKVKINLGDIALEQREFEDALHYFQEIEKLLIRTFTILKKVMFSII